MKPETSKESQDSYCFIDASNLFYGGEKVLGWKIDYEKLYKYLRTKYKVRQLFYYGGVETYHFEYTQDSNRDFPIEALIKHLEEYLTKEKDNLSEAELELLDRHTKKAKFYEKLSEIGYILKLKPVKTIKDSDGNITKKANCDVDLAFDAMRLQNNFKRLVLLSGDGDFEVLLKYFEEQKKQVVILSNPSRTAWNIKKNFAKSYRNFSEIRDAIQYNASEHKQKEK